ncbi:hypothetical protein DCE79_01930 [Lysinibacillus sp. 2017]|nr:hypothetical protein [Lysinibacillus sp. S2017]AWE06216.1 hypothetical protein DCE79_01930 [Lysinibacillus sp. 2017]
MKVASLLHQMSPDFEERKRSLQRKEVGDVYKKHAKYADASKNPMLQALENLLSGKTEKDLHEADAAVRKETQASSVEVRERFFEQPSINGQLQQTNKDVIAPETENEVTGVNGSVAVASAMPISNEESDDTGALLEKLRQAALAPAQPSPQDLRVAASASAQLQQVRAEKTGEPVEELEELAPHAEEDLTFTMPERFEKDFARDPQEKTVFGQDLEKLLFKRTFNNAATKYNSHVAMVKNGYRPVYEPIFSQIA